MTTYIGTLLWFDCMSDEGLVKTQDGYCLYVHRSAFESYIEDGCEVEYTVYETASRIQVDRVWPLYQRKAA